MASAAPATDGTASAGAGFTEREAEVYDRQIRLWGVEAQQRMKNATVLIAGLSAINVELCKNLVLSGFSVVLADATPVSARDVGANFFVSAKDIGTPRATACLPAVKELNPLVQVEVSSTPIEDLSSDDLRRYTMVAVSGYPFDAQADIDARCREAGVLFVSSGYAGLYSYVFQDLGDHEYVTVAGESGTKTAHSVAFPSLRSALDCQWSGLRRVNPALFAFQIVDSYRATASTADLGEFAKAFCEKRSLADGSRPGTALLATINSTWGRELSPVAAVVGGLIGQEVVKAVSRKDEPACNWLVFDGTCGLGVLATLPPPSSA